MIRHKMECSICLDQFSPGDEIAWAKDGDPPPPSSSSSSSSSSSAPAAFADNNVGCDHIFHRGCLVAWLMNHDECPLCRRRLVHADADVRFAGWEMR
ncbi:hypothetical protein ACHAW5_003997 [Stephanodiscus triporus]|uniref:RING-type domain-containing protein n=1 Tax=Stephanodiscus triporus TaxID=2934178 RepID=A0ABD3MMG4_9STRA